MALDHKEQKMTVSRSLVESSIKFEFTATAISGSSLDRWYSFQAAAFATLVNAVCAAVLARAVAFLLPQIAMLDRIFGNGCENLRFSNLFTAKATVSVRISLHLVLWDRL